MSMLDSFGRQINYARVSVTDRCNLRCVYCMPKKGENIGENPLSLAAIKRACTAFGALGIRKIKVTGGEPLVREDIADLLRDIKSIPGIENVTLTTNGILLPRLLDKISPDILSSVNISLDSISASSYSSITRTGRLEDVLEGLNSTIMGGFKNIKINCVAIAGLNDAEIEGIAALAQDKDIAVRFIEIMPINIARQFKTLPQKEIATRLQKRFGELVPCDGNFGNGPAVYYRPPGFCGKIGFISAISHRFCKTCNRIRLTSGGYLKTCLHFRNGLDLRSLLEGGAPVEEISRQIERAIHEKPLGHVFGSSANKYEEEFAGMSQIGG